MHPSNPYRDDVVHALALTAPLLVRLAGEETEAALQRLVLLALALGIAWAWAAAFARAGKRPIGAGLPAFAMTFVVMLPGPVSWGAALLALSFGAVFGREMFGGRAILPPALIALSFAILAFPEGGFESHDVLFPSPDYPFALACVAAAAVLAWRGSFAWQIPLGAIAGTMVAALLADGSPSWDHLGRGAFAAGVLFLAAAHESDVGAKSARFLHGFLVGALVVLIRVSTPDEHDGVVFAALLGGLFAPLIERALRWRPRHG